MTGETGAATRSGDGPRPVLIGIAGVPGAGKTTLARALTAELHRDGVVAVHVPMDGFHLADAALRRLGRLDRKGAPDTFDPAGYAALLTRIRAGEPVWSPAFERELEQPLAGAIDVPAGTPVVVSEGNYLLLDAPAWRAARETFDEVWFLDAPDGAHRRERLIARHERFGKRPEQARAWVRRVDDANAALVAPTAAAADLVVSRSNER